MPRLIRLVVVLVVVAGLAVWGIRVFGPFDRRPIATLDAANLPAFQAQFDTARDSTRLLVLLSPT